MISRLTQQQFLQGSVPSLPSIADSKNTVSLAALAAQFPPPDFDSNLPDKQISSMSNFSNFSLNDIEFFNPDQLTAQDVDQMFSPHLGEDEDHSLASAEVWNTQSSPAV